MEDLEIKDVDKEEKCVLCRKELHNRIPIPDKYKVCCDCIKVVGIVLRGAYEPEPQEVTAMRYKNGKFTYYKTIICPSRYFRKEYLQMDKEKIKRITDIFTIKMPKSESNQ